jgi:hypothetical protein
VNRFGILWRPLEMDLPKASRIVSACALLRNNTIYKSNATELDAVQSDDERLCAVQSFRRWRSESQRLRAASRSGSGTRSDLERSSLRNIQVARHKELGQTRPDKFHISSPSSFRKWRSRFLQLLISTSNSFIITVSSYDRPDSRSSRFCERSFTRLSVSALRPAPRRDHFSE